MSTPSRTVHIPSENRMVLVPRQDTQKDRTLNVEERF
jgi:hypothetical protein